MKIRKSESISKTRSAEPGYPWRCRCFNTRRCNRRSTPMRAFGKHFHAWLFCLVSCANAVGAAAQSAKSPGQTEWDKTLERARKESRVGVPITTRNDLRAAIEK